MHWSRRDDGRQPGTQAPGQIAPTSGALSPLWGLAARPFAFQGLAPLATNLVSSGAGTRNAQNERNTGATYNAQNERNAGSTCNAR